MCTDKILWNNELNVALTKATKPKGLDATKRETEIRKAPESALNTLFSIKSNGQRVQQIDIYYTAVGLIDVSQHIQELLDFIQ